jgi:four helix bundle protein
LNIAEASLAEAAYCIHAAMRLGFISEDVAQEIDDECRRVNAPLAGLIRSIKAS